MVDEEKDGINTDKNMIIYNLLLEKSVNDIFGKRSANQSKTFANGLEKFRKLSLDEQCKIILEMLKYFKCNAELSDLKALGGSGNAGKLLISKELSKYSSAWIINQSPTGLFESKLDLLKI